jgi:DNA-binding NtrC family response regulator
MNWLTSVASFLPGGTSVAHASPAMTHSYPTILLVDAEDMLREATATMLSKNGGRVHRAATLDEAIEYASEFVYDVTVVDESPDSPCAAEVLERMHALGCHPGRVVVCTRDPTPSTGGEFAEVIAKPFPFDRLVRAVFGAPGARVRTRSGLFPSLAAAKTPRRGAASAQRALRTPARASRGRRGHG